MRKTLLALATLCIALFTQAQDVNTMYINYKSGETVEVEVAEVESITFTKPFKTNDLWISRIDESGRYNWITSRGENVHYWHNPIGVNTHSSTNAAFSEAKDCAEYNIDDIRVIDIYYNEDCDLDDYIGVCLQDGTSHREFTQMEEHNLGIAYTMADIEVYIVTVDGLKIMTDENKFIKLKGSVVTPTTYNFGDYHRSSIGRRPIIMAELYQEKNGQKTTIKTAYIVLQIVTDMTTGGGVGGGSNTYETTFNEYNFTTTDYFGKEVDFCDGDVVEITAEQMNYVYTGEKVSKEEFASNYLFYPTSTSIRINGKTYITTDGVNYSANPGAETTYGLTWALDAEYIWNNAGTTPKATAIYRHKNKDHYVIINLTTKQAIPSHKADLQLNSEKIEEYWKNDLTIADFTTRVPYFGENTSEQCVFENDILTLFRENKDPKTLLENKINTSIYKVSSVTGVSNVDVEYVITGATCSGQKTKGTFRVVNGTILNYRVSGTDHFIAELRGNSVFFNNDHTDNVIAEELLNTNNLVVTFDVKAEFESCLGTYAIPTEGGAAFDVHYVCPINVKNSTSVSFQDGVDFGGEGTLLKTSDVIALFDWRNREITKDSYLFGYYGISRVTVDNSEITCNTKAGNNIMLPVGIKAGIVDNGAKNDASLAPILGNLANDEWLFYYNYSGTVLQDNISINFPVIVEYWWGKVVTETVTVTVKKANY